MIQMTRICHWYNIPSPIHPVTHSFTSLRGIKLLVNLTMEATSFISEGNLLNHIDISKLLRSGFLTDS